MGADIFEVKNLRERKKTKNCATELSEFEKMPQVTFKIEKQAPTISVTNGSSENVELFHGIGNTLGFNITGGSDFSMPITIFHVSRSCNRQISSACSICENCGHKKEKSLGI